MSRDRTVEFQLSMLLERPACQLYVREKHGLCTNSPDRISLIKAEAFRQLVELGHEFKGEKICNGSHDRKKRGAILEGLHMPLERFVTVEVTRFLKDTYLHGGQ